MNPIYKVNSKFNPLIYIDDKKLFAKDEKELETLITIQGKDIGINFAI